MGIAVEFNPDLALRNIRDYQQGKRSLEECIPEHLEQGTIYAFLKQGQRNYWLKGEIPLRETQGNQQLSRPLASVRILETTQFVGEDEQVYTKGIYCVVDVFDPQDPTIHFDGLERKK